MDMATFEMNPIIEFAQGLYGRAYDFLTLQHFERTVYLSFVAYVLFCNNPASHIIRVDHFYMIVLLLVSNENLGKRLSNLYQIDLETSFLVLNFMVLLLLHPLGLMLLSKFIDYFFIMELDKFFISCSKDREREVERRLRRTQRQTIRRLRQQQQQQQQEQM